MTNTGKSECRDAYQLLAARIRTHYKSAVDLISLNKAFGAAEQYAAENDSRILQLLQNLKIAQYLARLQSRAILLVCAVLLDVPRNEVRALNLRDVSDTLEVYDALNQWEIWRGNRQELSPHWPNALQLRCAVAHREFRLKSSTALEHLIYVRDVLLPMAERMNLRYFTDLLRNDCYSSHLWIDPELNFGEVAALTQNLTSVSLRSYQQFDALMLDALEQHQQFSALNDGNCALRRPVSCWDIKEQIAASGNRERGDLDLWEVFLFYNGNWAGDMIRAFIRLHCEYLSDTFTIKYIGQDGYCVTFRLTDTIDNNYRIRLIPLSKVHAHFFADEEKVRADYPIGSRSGIAVYVSDPENPRKKYRKILIPRGATVLDAAFYASPTDAVLVHGARIRPMIGGKFPEFQETDPPHPLYTLLRENDVIEFDRIPFDAEHSKPRASIDWFASLNTACARACLIQYLKEQYS
ncbi:MAG: hypothetical protein IKJ99_09720 [Oscillospiraceae bacterium]|nr:hypothetical protein [Oscillospiraceae bacterium]